MSVPGDSTPSNSTASLPHRLSSKTPFLSLKLYVVIAILSAFLLLVSLLIFLCVSLRRTSRKRRMLLKQNSGSIPPVSKEIVEIKTVGAFVNSDEDKGKIGNADSKKEEIGVLVEEMEIGKGGKKGRSEGESSGGGDGMSTTSNEVAVEAIGWGRWYSLKELETATRGFAEENVIGEGGYGVVYRGVLQDGSVVAVKNLLNNKGQAEKEFKVEVEAIGKVRHKNLVGLIGYCAEVAQRMLVYEYVDNGNLEQWLHGDLGPYSPLTWDIRMKIAIGTAKGLAYLHEGLEPKVVHRDVKSSNILLDKKWNPKVSDFGLAKLLGSEASYVTTRVMGTFGYVSPEYASTGMLNEGSDVYSFGVLLMEIITGRSPIDYSRPAGETNLVDWFKGMVASRRGEEVLDRRIEVQPSSRALKRALLVCFRCIDLDAIKRPKMGQIVHMLEVDDFPFRSKPDIAGLAEFLKPLNEVIMKANAMTEGRRSDFFNHLKAAADSLTALAWIAYTGKDCGMAMPIAHVEESWQMAEFYNNKVLVEYRNKDPNHVEWAKALKELFLPGLRDYVKSNYPLGPVWSATGKAVAAPSKAPTASAPAPPPAPPASLFSSESSKPSSSSQKQGMSAVFKEINSKAVTSGLRKVTNDMKTKNRADRTSVVGAVEKERTTSPSFSKAGPPKLELQMGRKWVVENQIGRKNLVIDDCDAKQSVYVFGCKDSVLQIQGKVNNITVDKCTKMGVVFLDVVAACEIVNCNGVEVQCQGSAPTISVDNTGGCQLYLSKDALGTSITTAKSSEINVMVPGTDPDGDWVEHALPQQFSHVMKDGKFETTPVSHSGG